MPPEVASHAGLFLTLLAVGGVGGLLSGMLGVGGGIVFVPALYFTLNTFAPGSEHIMRVCIGTSLALVLATGASSAFWHNKKGSVDFSIIKSWAPAVFCGVVAGTYFASSVNGHFLKQLFATIALLISIYMAVSKEPKEGAAHRLSKAVQRAVAAFIAFVASLIGIGGAMLNIPFMAYMGVSMRKCVGTGGALAFVISFPAMFGYIFTGLSQTGHLPPYCIGYVNWLALVCILPVSMILSPIGVHISHKMDRQILRRIFSVVLIVVAIRMFTS